MRMSGVPPMAPSTPSAGGGAKWRRRGCSPSHTHAKAAPVAALIAAVAIRVAPFTIRCDAPAPRSILHHHHAVASAWLHA
jgi:hypothetical protein